MSTLCLAGRLQLLLEFLDRSNEILNNNRDEVKVWLLRGTVAIELQDEDVGMDAGYNLIRLKQHYEDDEKILEVLAKLDRRGWLKPVPKELLSLYQSAKEGDADSQVELGYLYETGEKVFKDDEEALRWYQKASKQGNAYAQARLGYMHMKGTILPINDDEALQWFRKSAEQGDGTGQAFLGFMYEHGKGVEKDEVEAVKWYKKSAEQGNGAGQAYLGSMHEHGRGGLPQNKVEASKWYQKAAETNSEDALRALKSAGKFPGDY